MSETKTMCKTISLFLAVCLSVSPVFAQQAPIPPAIQNMEEGQEEPSSQAPKEGVTIYDLPKALQKAIEISPSIDSAELDKVAAQWQLSEAKQASILPVLDLKVLGGVTPDVPNNVGPGSNFPPVDTDIADLGTFTQIRLEAFMPIYTFGKLSNLRRAAQQGVEAKDQGIDKARNELIYQVKRAYVGLTTLYTLKDFLTDLQSRANQAKELVTKKIRQKSSEVTDIDLMRLDLFIGETERRMAEINNGIEFTVGTLKVLMGLPRNELIDIKDQRLVMDNTVIQPLENYLEIAKKNRPEISQLKNLVEAREAAMKISEANFYPSLGIAGFYRYGYSPGRPDIRNPFLVDDFNFNSGGGFLVLSQNLSFLLSRTRFKQNKAQYEKAIADQQRALQGIEIEIRKAYNGVLAKQQGVESAKRAFKSGRSWVLASTLNMGVGVTPPKELLEAFVAYSTVRVNYLQTISEYFIAMAELSNAIGQEVTNMKY